MYKLSIASALAGIMILHLAATSPIKAAFHSIRQTNVCTDPRFDFDSSCWSTLNLDTSLASWNRTICVRDDDPTCCQSDELWSSCFIRLGTNGTDHDDCSRVANSICASEPPYGSSIAPEVRYIIHNIYCKRLYPFLSCPRLVLTSYLSLKRFL